jgi:hypothetical protein
LTIGQAQPGDVWPAQVAASQLVIVGTVVQVSDTSGPVSLVSPDANPSLDRLREARVAVKRVLYGSPTGPLVSVLYLEGKQPNRPWLTLRPGDTDLLFLRLANSAWAPVAPTLSPLPASPDVLPPAADATREAAVAHELEQVILSDDAKTTPDILANAALARAQLPGDADLGQLASPALQDPVRRAAWIAIALADGHVEALRELPPLATRSPAAVDALAPVLAPLVSQVDSASARPYLVALLHASPAMAWAAATALRQLHDPRAIPDLVAALDNPEQAVRYQAVMGLAELVPDVDAGPSWPRFQQNEAEYLQRWKRWWQTQSGSS